MDVSKKEARKGTILMLLTGITFSLGGVCMKIVPVGGFAVNSIRCFIAFIMVFVFLKIRHHKFKVNKAVLVGAFCLSATATLYAVSIKLTTAGNSIILQFTAPVWGIIIGALFLHKPAKKDDIIACIAVFAGIAMCFLDGISDGHTLGNILALISGITYSGVFMMNTSEDSDSFSSMVIGLFASFIIALPAALKADYSQMDGKAWFALIFAGVVQLGLSYILMAFGLESVPPVTAALTTGLEPVLNPIWVAMFYGEVLAPMSIAGCVVVLVSITIYNVYKVKKSDAS